MISFNTLVIQSIYGALSVALYIRVLYVLHRKSLFKGKIYDLLKVLGYVDVTLYIVMLPLYRWPLCPVFFDVYKNIEPNRPLGVILFLVYCICYLQYWLHLAITINRFTAIAFPLSHKKIWKKTLPYYYVLAGITIVSFSFHRLFSLAAFPPFEADQPQQGYNALIVQYDLYELDNQIIMLSVAFSFSFMCFALNISTFILLMRYHTKEERNKIMTVENVPTGQAEINIFIVAVCMVIFQTGNGCFQWLFFIFRKNNMSHALNILFAQLPWISDLNSLSTPWVLIIVNSAIRRQVFPFNSLKSYCKHSKIFSVHSSNNIQ